MGAGRDFVSVHRSLQRFLSTALADQVVIEPDPSDPGATVEVAHPWDVQPVRQEPQVRPLCVVQPLNAGPSRGSAYVREYVQPFEVAAYPLGVEGEPWPSQLIARSVLQALLRAIDSGNGATGRDRSYSMRVPLFDYVAVPEGEAVPVDAVPVDFLVIQGLDGTVRQDPEQDDLYTVLIDFSVNWRDDGDVRRYDGAVLASTTLDERLG